MVLISTFSKRTHLTPMKVQYVRVRPIYNFVVGWLFKLSMKNADELKSLMNEEQYNTFLKTEKDSHS